MESRGGRAACGVWRRVTLLKSRRVGSKLTEGQQAATFPPRSASSGKVLGVQRGCTLNGGLA
jgi:hypothetical protein